jgi:hypothetical protein
MRFPLLYNVKIQSAKTCRTNERLVTYIGCLYFRHYKEIDTNFLIDSSERPANKPMQQVPQEEMGIMSELRFCGKTWWEKKGINY